MRAAAHVISRVVSRDDIHVAIVICALSFLVILRVNHFTHELPPNVIVSQRFAAKASLSRQMT